MSRLQLRHFRNLGIQDIPFPPEGVAIVGDNAQGKSNLLEAIYYLETFRSFRGARDERVVTHGEEFFRVVGAVDGGTETSEVAVAYERQGRHKKVAVDGVEPEKLGEALGRLSAVIFSPSDGALVSGGPVERRRFLDIVLSLNVPGYLTALQRFRHALAQRNAALKGDMPRDMVCVWDNDLVRYGAEVAKVRREWIRESQAGFSGYYDMVSGGERGRMVYRPGIAGTDSVEDQDLEEAYRTELRESESRELRRRATVVGPHRDDVQFRAGQDEAGLDLREYGSGGQRKTAVLALRMVEADAVRDARGQDPIVLLDDVFAELDPGRSERVLELMERRKGSQFILTAPKESEIRIRKDRLPRWAISRGRVATA